MAELSTITVSDDSAVNFYLLEPVNDSGWREASNTKALKACITSVMESLKLKSGVTRRLIKTNVPVMEQVSGANAQGYTAAPEVAHVIQVSLGVFCNEERATPEQIAHAVKMAFNSFLADATAGTAGAYVSRSNAQSKFLISGIAGD